MTEKQVPRAKRIRKIVPCGNGWHTRRCGHRVEFWLAGTSISDPPNIVVDQRLKRGSQSRRGRPSRWSVKHAVNDDFLVALMANRLLQENPQLSERAAVMRAVDTLKLEAGAAFRADERVRKIVRELSRARAEQKPRPPSGRQVACLDRNRPGHGTADDPCPICGPWLPN